jgi:hypothetical protein
LNPLTIRTTATRQLYDVLDIFARQRLAASRLECRMNRGRGMLSVEMPKEHGCVLSIGTSVRFAHSTIS